MGRNNYQRNPLHQTGNLDTSGVNPGASATLQGITTEDIDFEAKPPAAVTVGEDGARVRKEADAIGQEIITETPQSVLPVDQRGVPDPGPTPPKAQRLTTPDDLIATVTPGQEWQSGNLDTSGAGVTQHTAAAVMATDGSLTEAQAEEVVHEADVAQATGADEGDPVDLNASEEAPAEAGGVDSADQTGNLDTSGTAGEVQDSADAVTPDDTPDDGDGYDDLTIAKLREILDGRGIESKSSDKKDELVARLRADYEDKAQG